MNELAELSILFSVSTFSRFDERRHHSTFIDFHQFLLDYFQLLNFFISFGKQRHLDLSSVGFPEQTSGHCVLQQTSFALLEQHVDLHNYHRLVEAPLLRDECNHLVLQHL